MNMRGAIVLSSMLLLSACNFSADAQDHEVKPSGEAGMRTFQVGAFEKVALGGPHNVVVAVGPAPSVRAEGDLGIIDKLDIHVENGTLKIDNKKGFSFSWKSHGKPVTIYVTAPALAGASIGGSGDMTIDKVSGDTFDAAIGGSGDMEIGAVQVKTARFSIAGSGGIRAKGSAESGDMSIAGSGDVMLGGLEVQRANVSIVGSGNVQTRARQTADVSITGSGDVEISGGAKCNVSKMGSGEVRCS
jgi:hypothetical protein